MLVVAQAMQAHDSYHHGVSSVEMPPAVCRTYFISFYDCLSVDH